MKGGTRNSLAPALPYSCLSFHAFLALLLLLMLVTVHSWADAPPVPQVEFSAESVTESGGVTLKEKIYYAPGMLRKELEVPHGKQIEITRLDKKVAWLLMTEEHLYLEQALAAVDEGTPAGMRFEQTAAGEEPVNGIPTTKYKAVATQPDGRTLSGYVWSTKEGITVKMDLVSDGTPATHLVMEFKNLQIGKLAPSLFEVPSGYRRFSLSGPKAGQPAP